MNSFTNISNGNMNPSAVVYQYPPVSTIGDGYTFVVSGQNYGNGTYSVSGSVTMVQNGGFELPVLAQGVSSWSRTQMSTAEQTQFVWLTANPGAVGVTNAGSYNGYPYPSPVQIGYIANSGPAIYQNVYLQAGNYTLSFYLLQRDATPDTVTIYVNNVAITTVTPPSETVWTYYSYSYTAVSDGAYEIKFGSNVALTGVGIDKVEISPAVNKIGRVFNRQSLKYIFNPNSQITSTVSSQTITGDYISIQLPSSIYLQYYSFYQDADSNPTSWILAGSTDGTTWTSLHDVSSYTPTINSTYFSKLNITSSYNRFRFILRAGSGTYNKLSKLAFYSHSAF